MVISGFPSQRASNVEGVSIWWCVISSCGDITPTKNTTKHSLSLRDIPYIPNNGINHEDTPDNPERPTSLFDTYDKPYNIFIILGRISGGNGSYILIINSLVPGRSGCNFVNEIFCLAFLIGIFESSYDNTIRWMLWDCTNDNSTLVQVIAWCHYLNQCWPSSMMPYAITRGPELTHMDSRPHFNAETIFPGIDTSIIKRRPLWYQGAISI